MQLGSTPGAVAGLAATGARHKGRRGRRRPGAGDEVGCRSSVANGDGDVGGSEGVTPSGVARGIGGGGGDDDGSIDGSVAGIGSSSSRRSRNGSGKQSSRGTRGFLESATGVRHAIRNLTRQNLQLTYYVVGVVVGAVAVLVLFLMLLLQLLAVSTLINT